MTDHAMRGFVRAFCNALSTRDMGLMAPFLHDEIEWTAFGPVDLFSFFGQRRGKAAVLSMCEEIAATLELTKCDKETTLYDGDNAACLMKLAARDPKTGRILSFRLAQFARFQGGKLISLKAVFDTFDAAEQALGRPIDLSAVA
jgi:ketosteroid isomerase-like protein